MTLCLSIHLKRMRICAMHINYNSLQMHRKCERHQLYPEPQFHGTQSKALPIHFEYHDLSSFFKCDSEAWIRCVGNAYAVPANRLNLMKSPFNLVSLINHSVNDEIDDWRRLWCGSEFITTWIRIEISQSTKR